MDELHMGTPVPGRHDGKVAIVTGASRGIGRAVACRLAAEGANVVVAAKSAEPHPTLEGTIHDTVERIRTSGGVAEAVQIDVRDGDAVQAMVDETAERWGGVHLLFNNAGAIHLARVIDMPLKRFDLVMGVNVRASFATSHAALPYMVQQKWGHILNFSPPLHSEASPNMGPYMVSKFGMTRLALSIAEEHRGDNIAANSIWPVTMIDTAAVRVNALGEPSQWRTPEIICDAVSELFSRDPSSCSGRQLTDEDVLREAGVDNFDHYWVEGHPPEHVVRIVGEASPLR
jgi:citronellol/citronellal dehydrogenase